MECIRSNHTSGIASVKTQLQFRSLSTNHSIPNSSSADADASIGCNARARRFTRENTSAKIAMAMISAAAAQRLTHCSR
jgi:hypothetical protein